MKKFSGQEIKALLIIFLFLVIISVPNFILSLRRARDQVRKDDMGSLQKVLGEYFNDFHEFPLATSDGRIIACKNPGDKIELDKYGHLVGNLIPCEWGRDALIDLASENSKVYMPLLPREPNYQKGAAYKYLSDGQHMQILVSLEGKEEDEYNPKIIARNLACGNLTCNAGRFYGCPSEKSFEECTFEEQKRI